MFSLKHTLSFSSVTLWEWSQRPSCYSLDGKCPPQAHVSEHCVPSWRCCFGRLWKLWDTGPGWQTQATVGTPQWGQPGPVSALTSVFWSIEMSIIYTTSSTYQSKAPGHSRLCFFKPWTQMQLSSLELLLWGIWSHNNYLKHLSRVAASGIEWAVTSQVLGFLNSLECLDVLCIRIGGLSRLSHR